MPVINDIRTKNNRELGEKILNVLDSLSTDNKQTLCSYTTSEKQPNLKHDPVNHPSHYVTGNIECIEAIKASMNDKEFAGYLKGNVIKYLWRYELKNNPVEDLKKAAWYLDKLIKETTLSKESDRYDP